LWEVLQQGRQKGIGVVEGKHVMKMRRISEKHHVDVWGQRRWEAYFDWLQSG
jgi:hypothetical protein